MSLCDNVEPQFCAKQFSRLWHNLCHELFYYKLLQFPKFNSSSIKNISILRIFTYFLFTVIYLITVHISTHMPRNHWHPSPIVTHLVINWAYPEATDKKTIFDIYTICFSDSNLIYLIIQIRLWFIPFQLKNW